MSNPTMDELTLLPCPFCGSADVEPTQDSNFHYWAVWCKTCDAEGPAEMNQQDATDRWQERSSHSASDHQ